MTIDLADTEFMSRVESIRRLEQKAIGVLLVVTCAVSFVVGLCLDL